MVTSLTQRMKTLPTRLLLVEDDEDDYLITKNLLEDITTQRYTLDWANSVEAAREALAQNAHDVCLMDYSLGPEDGLSLLKEAATLGFKGPIIMLTGQDDDRLDAEAQSAGAVDYLVKMQLNASHLTRAIRYAISRKEMEHERVERLRAESQNRAKTAFLAHLSHELRTPLTAILGYTDILLSDIKNSAQSTQLRVIKRNGNHLLSLLNDVLDLSKIEAGKLEIERHTFLLTPLISDIYRLMSVNASDKAIAFHCHASTTIPSQLHTDATRLRQILLNLISNAIKFTDQGGVDILLELDESNSPATLQFHVIDTGIGIPPEELNKLFKPFSQATNGQNRSESGTGLGLAISRQLAKRLGGEITVQSEHDRGSRFTLALPCGEVELAKREVFALSPEEDESIPMRVIQIDARVLVADDIPEIRHLVGHLIRQAGADVVFAANGQEALDQIALAESEGKPIDIVLLDMQMPVLTGFEVAEKLRAQQFSKPIIALTAATMRGQREKCLEAGCTDHFSKPIDPRQLLERIRRHLHADDTADPTQESAIRKKQQILLVEDQQDAREITTLLLNNIGYDVMAAENGSQALRFAQEVAPDVVLLDIHLPDMSGFELARKLRRQELVNTTIIALSGADINRQQMDEAGIDAFQLKPINLETLRKLLPETLS